MTPDCQPPVCLPPICLSSTPLDAADRGLDVYVRRAVHLHTLQSTETEALP